MKINIYDSETLEYRGSILADASGYRFHEVNDDHMISITAGMPLKALLSNLIIFDYVYDIITEQGC